MDKKELTKKIKMKALELGFSKVGITTADPFLDYEKELLSRRDYDGWINAPIAKYLGKGLRPREIWKEAKSIVCTVYAYGHVKYPEELTKHVGRAYLSRSYLPLPDSSCGLRVNNLIEYIESLGCNVYKGEIDIPNRMACARAGIITYGKNNFAYTEEDGSFIILYTIMVDTELEYDEPTIECNCPPNCHKCIDACPNHAILKPGRLHPQSCTLMNHIFDGGFLEDVRDGMGTYIHGCDICQEVCPRNKHVLEKAERKDPFLEELKKDFDLEKILFLDEKYYEDVVHPIMYNYIRNFDVFRKNAAIAIGNTGDKSYIPALEKAIEMYDNPVVQEAAKWAIEKISKSN
ncbi:epoxyqueuosine reductase [Intestinibacter sp.]|uniref:epoxyqueuosine reductase n=1 Tax=Intestinibacter sp. TaxID=1965304 RepID=UPI003F18518C